MLCTPIAQPYYREGLLVDRLGGYDDAVRRLAQYYHLPLLDLETLTRAWWSSLSEDDATAYIAGSKANEAVVLTESGAREVAKMAADAIKLLKSSKVAKIIKK